MDSLAVHPVLTALSPHLTVLKLRQRASPALVSSCIRRTAAGVLKVKLPRLAKGDELLRAFAECPAASTLRKIDFTPLGIGLVTDHCAPLWAAFKAVETIKLDSPITRDTMAAILDVPSVNLRRLHLASDLVSPVDILRDIISRGLKLTHVRLCCSNSDEEALQVEEIKKILRSNVEFSQRLVEFIIHTSDANVNREFDSLLRELRPALYAKRPPLARDRRPSVDSLLPIGEAPPDEMTQELLERVAARFPNLTKLKLRIFNWSATDLSCLPCLRELHLQLGSMDAAPLVWPQSLRRLQLDFAGWISSRPVLVTAEELVANVCRNLPDLTCFDLQHGSRLSIASIQLLLASAQRLRSLHLSCDFETGVMPLSHPALREIPHFRGLLCQIGCLPHLFSHSQELDSPASPLSPGKIPELTWCSFDIPRLDLHLIKRLPLLRQLSLRSGEPEAALALPESFAELTSLCDLDCYNISNPALFWSSYFTLNQRMKSLRFSFEIRNPTHPLAPLDFSFLETCRLPLLVTLSLSNWGAEPILRVRLSGGCFPNLSHVRLSVSNINEICLEGLPNLAELILDSDRQGPDPSTHLSVSDCPRLLSMQATSFSVSKLNLRNLGGAINTMDLTFERVFFRFASPAATGTQAELAEMITILGVPTATRLSISEPEFRAGNTESQRLARRYVQEIVKAGSVS